jgi:8-oxo-dGTP diphosphatase
MFEGSRYLGARSSSLEPGVWGLEPVVVVAAVIERDGAFLVTLRPAGSHLAGHWEFPGGKCLPHETHVDALRRELLEELDIAGVVGECIFTVTHAYVKEAVALHFYRCEYSGTPKPMLGQQMRWVPRGELRDLKFPEADAALIDLLAGSP